MLKNSKITLSNERFTEAYELGKQRYLSNRSNGVIDQHIGDADWYVMDGEGVCGEFAFAQMINAPQDQWERIREVGTRSACQQSDQGDCSYMGYNFDVKTTKYTNGHLILFQSKLQNLEEGYALFTGFGGEYIFRGAISRERILRDQHLYLKHHTNSIWIHQRFLRELPSQPKLKVAAN